MPMRGPGSLPRAPAYAARAPESTSADPPGPAGENGPAVNSPATSLVTGGRRVQLPSPSQATPAAGRGAGAPKSWLLVRVPPGIGRV